jgi:hypothetical protein
MTSSNALKKLVSFGAAMLLAVGGSLVAAEPAMALNPTPLALSRTDNWGPGISQVGHTASNAMINVQPTFNFFSIASGTPTFEVHWFACTSALANISSDVTDGVFSNTLPAGCAEVSGTQADDSYTATSAELGKYIGVWTKATVGSGWRAVWSKTTTSALTGGAAAPVVSAGTPASSSTTNTTQVVNFTTSAVGNFSWSVRSSSSAAPTASYLLAASWGSLDLKHGGGTFMTLSTVNLPITSLSAGTSYVFYVAQSGAGGNSNVLATSFTTSGSAPVTPGASTTSTVVSEAAKPLPVWAAPILKAIPTLSKTLTTAGGKIGLTDGDFSSLKSVTIGGAAVAFSIDAKGDVNIPVPAGKGGTTADLIVTFTGGMMTIQDGIKYVEPVNVAAVREAPISGFKDKSTKITGALADSIQYAAQLDKKATTVLCTGYAASKAQLVLATARANAACAYATKVNDLLVNKTVKVVVNAKLAKTAAVGIKVYK